MSYTKKAVKYYGFLFFKNVLNISLIFLKNSLQKYPNSV